MAVDRHKGIWPGDDKASDPEVHQSGETLGTGSCGANDGVFVHELVRQRLITDVARLRVLMEVVFGSDWFENGTLPDSVTWPVALPCIDANRTCVAAVGLTKSRAVLRSGLTAAGTHAVMGTLTGSSPSAIRAWRMMSIAQAIRSSWAPSARRTPSAHLAAIANTAGPVAVISTGGGAIPGGMLHSMWLAVRLWTGFVRSGCCADPHIHRSHRTGPTAPDQVPDD